uniref:Uncharacterized protein n=1 Tax=Arundo donax TaxID=35708 RepID=A0A0A9FDB5_ARUDO
MLAYFVLLLLRFDAYIMPAHIFNTVVKFCLVKRFLQ